MYLQRDAPTSLAGLSLEDTIGGVFVDERGAVKALWVAYCNCSHDEELFEQFEGLPIEVRATWTV